MPYVITGNDKKKFMVSLPIGRRQEGIQNRCRRALFSGCLWTAAIILLASCHKITGDGPPVGQSRETADFSGIKMSLSGVLRYTPDDVYKIEIKAQKNIQPVIETAVRNGRLEIGLKKDTRLGSHKPVEVIIHAPGISSLEISGSAHAFITKPLHADHLSLNISGSGNIETSDLMIRDETRITLSGSGAVFMGGLETGAILLDISGSGSIQAGNGQAVTEHITISGSGKADISAVAAEEATVHNSGSGQVRLNVSKKLDVHISGSGSIYYKGTPQITTQISGSGKIIPL